MDSGDVIILDSSDDETKNEPPPKSGYEKQIFLSSKRKNDRKISVLDDGPKKKIRRIKPIQLSNTVTATKEIFETMDENTVLMKKLDNKIVIETAISDTNDSNKTENSVTMESSTSKQLTSPDGGGAGTPVSSSTITNVYFNKLLDVCRSADSSNDMELLINKKLIRYYNLVHPDFTTSRSFRKTIESVTREIEASPELVYLKLKNIVEELKIRRKSQSCVITNEEVTTTGDKRRDNQILRLNKALYILKKKIAKLEEAEVDFDEEINSSYLAVERYKKRAWEIYQKICDITGESKHAQRSVRKPISFNGTVYPEFNKAIQTFVNRTNTFPDFVDVFKCLEYCNNQHDFRLKTDEMRKIAEDAFVKVGKLLQNRRKTDLYETVTYFVGADKDPANEDADLLTKLNDNKKFHSNINAILDKFAEEQEHRKDDIGSTPKVSADASISLKSELLSGTTMMTTTNGLKNETITLTSSLSTTTTSTTTTTTSTSDSKLVTKIEIEDSVVENNNEVVMVLGDGGENDYNSTDKLLLSNNDTMVPNTSLLVNDPVVVLDDDDELPMINS